MNYLKIAILAAFMLVQLTASQYAPQRAKEGERCGRVNGSIVLCEFGFSCIYENIYNIHESNAYCTRPPTNPATTTARFSQFPTTPSRPLAGQGERCGRINGSWVRCERGLRCRRAATGGRVCVARPTWRPTWRPTFPATTSFPRTTGSFNWPSYDETTSVYPSDDETTSVYPSDDETTSVY